MYGTVVGAYFFYCVFVKQTDTGSEDTVVLLSHSQGKGGGRGDLLVFIVLLHPYFNW